MATKMVAGGISRKFYRPELVHIIEAMLCRILSGYGLTSKISVKDNGQDIVHILIVIDGGVWSHEQ